MLNIPVTVIEEGRKEPHQYVSLYVTVSCSLTRKCLKTINAPVVLCECVRDVHWVYTAYDCFVLEHLCIPLPCAVH